MPPPRSLAPSSSSVAGAKAEGKFASPAEKNSDSAPGPRMKRGRNISSSPFLQISCLCGLLSLWISVEHVATKLACLPQNPGGNQRRGNSVCFCSCDIPYSPHPTSVRRRCRRQLGDISLSIHDSHDHSAEKLVVGSACV